MSDNPAVADLVKEIKTTRDQILAGDAERMKVLDEVKAEVAKNGKAYGETDAKLTKIATDLAEKETKLQGLQETINNLSKKVQRPGESGEFSEEANRKAAIGLLRLKHELRVPKVDFEHPFQPSEDQIKEADIAIKGIRSLMHCTDMSQIAEVQRKALTSFNIGAPGFILPPEMSSRVLSCLVEPTDVTGLFSSMTISGPAVRFMVDNVLLDTAAWACETSCFANNPQPNLDGLGELEVRPETLRYIVCVTRELLEDASVNIES